jgi:hypothetical protein
MPTAAIAAATASTTSPGITRGEELYQTFLGARLPRTLVDWSLHARDCVAKFRGAYARNVEDPWFMELVHVLRTRSPEFAAWWETHDVQLARGGVKHYDHPDAGRLSFDYTVLDLADTRPATVQLVTYVPVPGTDTRDKMAALLGAASRPNASRPRALPGRARP